MMSYCIVETNGPTAIIGNIAAEPSYVYYKAGRVCFNRVWYTGKKEPMVFTNKLEAQLFITKLLDGYTTYDIVDEDDIRMLIAEYKLRNI